MMGSVQYCVKTKIDVFRNEALNLLKLVIYIWICMWTKDEMIIIALISYYSLNMYHGYMIM